MKVSNKKIQYGYIGVSHDVPQRWEQHKELAKGNASTKLHKKMKKSGFINGISNDDNRDQHKGYAHCIILYSELDMVEAYQLERKLIEDYNLVDDGLNSKKGGTVPSGNDHITAEHFVYYIYVPV